MAFLGDFGKIFLGGATTRDVGGSVGETLGQVFGGSTGRVVGGSIGRDIGKDLGEIGSSTVDVSAPPAGVDSVATTIPISQTSGFENQFGMSRGMDSRQAFIGGGLVGPAVTGLSRLFTKPGVGGALTGLGGALGFDFITDMFGNTKKARYHSQATARCQKSFYDERWRPWLCVKQFNDAVWEKLIARSGFDDFI